MMIRLFAFSSAVAEAAAHLASLAAPSSESYPWLLSGLLLLLPAGFALLKGTFSIVLKEPEVRFDFDPVYVTDERA